MRFKKPREIAFLVLRDWERHSVYLEDLLDRRMESAGMAGPDRKLTYELAYGVTRWRATLDWLIARQTDQRGQKPALRVLLRLGLYQLFWLDRVPDYAAVSETVELARQTGYGTRAGFVNAVLRGYVREREVFPELLGELQRRAPATGYSHPAWLLQRWQQRWGIEPTTRLMEWNNRVPTLYARRNALRAEARQLTERWREERVSFTPQSWEWTGPDLFYAINLPGPVSGLGSFQEGWFYVQDPSTALAVCELEPRPGERVLDLCAAPGGKTTLLAQQMQGQGQIVACDSSTERLVKLRENCTRLGVKCVEAHSSPLTGKGGKFDKVLVDAPCSNTGVMRRRVDVRWRLQPEELPRLRVAQLALLQQGAEAVRPQGLLVYSTCSLEPEENRSVVDGFLASHGGFLLEHDRELLPVVAGVDGAYVARMRRVR